MKKLIYILGLGLLMFSCQDYNEDNFDGYEDMTRPKNVTAYTYTFNAGTDVKTIVDGLNANKTAQDSAIAKAFNTAKVFSQSLQANDLVHYLFQSRYKSADVGSSVSFTYNYDSKRSAIVEDITTASVYTLSKDDYTSVWGLGSFTTYLTPSKSPEANLPALLAAEYPSAADSTIINVSYQYADQEPSGTTVELYAEGFESYVNANDPIDANGWTQFTEVGTRTWQAKIYSGNKYAQMSNGSTDQNIGWIISPQIDLGTTKGYSLSFDVNVGYYTAPCLKVLISTDPAAATSPSTVVWTDVTSKFSIPTTPASGYGVLASAGNFNLDGYSGKIFVAFKYEGNADATPIQTTTYQIDNVKVQYNTDKTKPYSANSVYVYLNNTWTKYPNVLVPSGKDYAEMGVSNLSATTAPNYLPAYLAKNTSYNQEGATRIVVYKTSSGYYADEYIFTGGSWTRNTFIETRTEQFVLADIDGSKTWIFDPSFILTLAKTDYQIMVDYVKDNIVSSENPDIVHSKNNAEYYYGFSSYYGNVSYREIDRGKDTTYPISGTSEEKVAFMNKRTIEGLGKFLATQYPTATPTVNGVKQYAKLTVLIYNEPNAATNVNWTYTMQCTGDKEWIFVERVGEDGRSEKAN